MLPPFAIQSEEIRAMAKHCTVGIEPRVSSERIILLDSQVFNSLVRNNQFLVFNSLEGSRRKLSKITELFQRELLYWKEMAKSYLLRIVFLVNLLMLVSYQPFPLCSGVLSEPFFSFLLLY